MANYRLRIGHSVGHQLVSNQGTYALTGQDATLTYVPNLGASPYTWYSLLDKATIPPHAGAGNWGSQYSVQEAIAPTAPTAVTVTTFGEFQSAVQAGARTITIGANINGGGANITGNLSDIDIIIPPGRLLRSVAFGSFGTPYSLNRVRFRGNTVGTRTGGQIHNMYFICQTAMNDIIFDGIDITGSGLSGGQRPAAINFEWNIANRVALINCRGASGSDFFTAGVSNLVVTGCSIYSGLLPYAAPSGLHREAWAFRVGPTSQSTPGLHVFYHNDIRTNRYHCIRMHPDPLGGYAWVSSNNFANQQEGNVLTAHAAMSTDADGEFNGFWALSNDVWMNTPIQNFTDFSSQETANYVRFLNNNFRSNILTNESQLLISGAGDVLRSGNTFSGAASSPAWKSTTPGDPSGLTWDLGA